MCNGVLVLAVAQADLFTHLQIILSTAVLLLIFAVKPITVLGMLLGA